MEYGVNRYVAGELPGSLDAMEKWLAVARDALKRGRVADSDGKTNVAAPSLSLKGIEEMACFLYNGMIHPLIRFPIKGALWYQGESNGMQKGGDPGYGKKMIVLTESWRKAWGQGDFPFYFVQLTSVCACRAGRWPATMGRRTWKSRGRCSGR
jgi:sialate O-acetylesterase